MSAHLFLRQDSSVPAPSELDITLTMAPPLFGNNVAYLFMGLTFVQAYTYYKYYKSDPLLLKIFVYSAVAIGVIETATESYVGYYYLVGGWGNISTLNTPPKPLIFQPLFDAILGTMAQSFFIWRIWTFGGRALITRIISVMLALLSVLSIICTVGFSIVFLNVDDQALLVEKTHIFVTTWLIGSAVADVAITVCMIAILQNAKSKAYFGETKDIISRLIRITIQAGSLTSALALVVLIVYTEVKIGNMHTLPAYLLGKSYIMSLLANLNARTGRRAQPNSEPSSISSYRKKRESRSPILVFGRSQSVGLDQGKPTTVHIHRDMIVQSDTGRDQSLDNGSRLQMGLSASDSIQLQDLGDKDIGKLPFNSV